MLQMPARTPAATAMAALTLDHLSGGRIRLGLGVSGPQVVEGWHGASFDAPLARTREYVGIVRGVLAARRRAHLAGAALPAAAARRGRESAQANVRPLRADVPIYLAAMGPRNVALAAEIADGWLPFLFAPSSRRRSPIATLPDGFDVAPMVSTSRSATTSLRLPGRAPAA